MFNRAIQTIRDGVLSLAYPQECRICSQPVESWNDGVVCSACWNNPKITNLFNHQTSCIKCHAPLPISQNFSSPDNATASTAKERTCGQCDAMPFTFARACGAYAGALQTNILFLKSQPHICPRLRQILLQTFTANTKFLLSDIVMPIPLHINRKLERGFNQAELPARLLTSHFNMQFDNHTLKRTENTERHRAGMDAFERMKSVKGVFQVKRSNELQNASVLLIDDVFTTGSTLCAATQVLLESGAAQVQILTIAKVTQTPNHNH